MISQNSILVLVFLLALCTTQLCEKPQKSFYMSYNAISNHDYLATLFQNISQSLPQYNLTYTDKYGTVFSILNFKPHLYYSEQYQKQSYYDQLSVNVSLGQLYMTYRFDMNIKYEDKVVSGWARGRTLVDQYQFLKRIILIDGALEWDPYNLKPITINSQFSIEYSEPKLTLNETTIYVQLLNDYLGTTLIKKNLVAKTNEIFAERLKYHLNHEELLGNTNILYKYGNITLNYVNIIKDFKMNNADTKGLEVFLIFGFQNGQQQCIELPKQFDEDNFGGVQQIISMGTVKATVQKAATMGLFNQVLDKKYEVPYFQFFMGDMGNFVQYANKLPAHDPIDIQCSLSQERASQLKVLRFDDHDLYVQVPEECIVSYKSSHIMKVTFDMNIVVRLVAEQDSINAMITNVGVYGDKYFSLEPKFVVTDPYIARYSLSAVLKGLIGKQVFGTGWKTFSRKYPVIFVKDDYLVVYDASQK